MFKDMFQILTALVVFFVRKQSNALIKMILNTIIEQVTYLFMQIHSRSIEQLLTAHLIIASSYFYSEVHLNPYRGYVLTYSQTYIYGTYDFHMIFPEILTLVFSSFKQRARSESTTLLHHLS